MITTLPFSKRIIPFCLLLLLFPMLTFAQSAYELGWNYDETIDMKLEAPFAYMEVPTDIRLEFRGCEYDLKFTKVNDQHIKVNRVYKIKKGNIKPEQFEEFKGFVKQVIEAEKTNVIFK